MLRTIQIVVWFMLACVIAFTLVSSVVMAWKHWLDFPPLVTNTVTQVTLVSVAVYGLALGIVIGVPALWRRWSWPKVLHRLGTIKPQLDSWKWVAVAYAAYLAASIAVMLILTAVVPAFDIDQEQVLGFDSLRGTEYIVGFLGLVVLAPIAEELLFRGYLFGTLRRYIAFWPSAVITSILFGIVHGQWNVGVDTFVLSIILCWLREKTGTIWGAVAVHAVKNVVAFTLLFVL